MCPVRTLRVCFVCYLVDSDGTTAAKIGSIKAHWVPGITAIVWGRYIRKAISIKEIIAYVACHFLKS